MFKELIKDLCISGWFIAIINKGCFSFDGRAGYSPILFDWASSHAFGDNSSHLIFQPTGWWDFSSCADWLRDIFRQTEPVDLPWVFSHQGSPQCINWLGAGAKLNIFASFWKTKNTWPLGFSLAEDLEKTPRTMLMEPLAFAKHDVRCSPGWTPELVFDSGSGLSIQ